ncbi:hypothetical protein BABINDRAFT_161829 [Babjeviella inositovora NRRL Y-12698]|uniref:Uncharacterized protein n=1 Tax=Babjeviella inositovora NRRL Y-12698 TaxID=984486 RepID=A0A1E3QNZ4_9ASCO|nr:uncharacterized protein BABINDRAFT_161829 [Babjeviella inositovora NRRL Y-12698]ODQ79429.1 hypothetical protein BABINDRAFT_161829 [Babjeviella inositovora NRRL Y-12698]
MFHSLTVHVSDIRILPGIASAQRLTAGNNEIPGKEEFVLSNKYGIVTDSMQIHGIRTFYTASFQTYGICVQWQPIAIIFHPALGTL